jgi:hypothetical protein
MAQKRGRITSHVHVSQIVTAVHGNVQSSLT